MKSCLRCGEEDINNFLEKDDVFCKKCLGLVLERINNGNEI